MVLSTLIYPFLELLFRPTETDDLVVAFRVRFQLNTIVLNFLLSCLCVTIESCYDGLRKNQQPLWLMGEEARVPG